VFKTLLLKHNSEVSQSVDVIYKRARWSVEAGSEAKYVVVMDGSRNQGNGGADGKRRRRAYNKGSGAEPQRGSRPEPLIRETLSRQ